MTIQDNRLARTGIVFLAGSGLLVAFILLARIIPAHWIPAFIIIGLGLDRLRPTLQASGADGTSAREPQPDRIALHDHQPIGE